jgi:hypothetical protein
MRLRVTDGDSARDLGDFLRERIGAVVDATEAASGELEVSLLGSFGEHAMREEVAAAVRQWTLARQGPASMVLLD